ncbi:MAG TPA: thioredoxin-like domain-containing protein [Bacteroidia bacterium]|jgi:thiol-disulfide isomerase/thioredoxin|nr:thioredoxin-like domain-containing protein [Bacteroidia bacterium]
MKKIFYTTLFFSILGLSVESQTTNTAPKTTPKTGPTQTTTQAPKTNANTSSQAANTVHYPRKTTSAKPLVDVKVKIHGLTSGDVMLANHYGDKQFLQDTVTADANGFVEFKADTLYPGGIYLVVLPSKKYFEIVMTDQQVFSVETDTTDLITHMKVTGNKENQYFYEYLNYLSSLQSKMEPIQKKYDAAKTAGKKDSMAIYQKQIAAIDSTVKAYKRDYAKNKHPETFMAEVLRAMDEPDQLPYSQCPKKANGDIDSSYVYWNFRNHYWDGMTFSDDRLIRTPVYANKLKFYLDKVVPQHPDSIAAACDYIIDKCKPSKELFKYTVYYCTYTYETDKRMGFDAIFVHLVDRYYATKQVWWVSEDQMTKILNRAKQLSYVQVGKPSVNLMLQDTSGVVKPLQSVKATYTVLIFWDPTCSHCKKEVPIIKAYVDSLHKVGVSVEVYGIYSELDYPTWKKFIRDNKLNWINVCAKDQQELATAKYYYDVFSTPTIVLLDENKNIIAKRIDAESLKTVLDRELSKAKKPN